MPKDPHLLERGLLCYPHRSVVWGSSFFMPTQHVCCISQPSPSRAVPPQVTLTVDTGCPGINHTPWVLSHSDLMTSMHSVMHFETGLSLCGPDCPWTHGPPASASGGCAYSHAPPLLAPACTLTSARIASLTTAALYCMMSPPKLGSRFESGVLDPKPKLLGFHVPGPAMYTK
jgi:hypothetical protein